MEYKINILPSAFEDLKVIQDYYIYNFNKDSAEKVTIAILKAINNLKTFPMMGTEIRIDDWIREKGYRMVISGDYAAIHRIIGEEIFVYNIVSTKKDYKVIFE